MRCAQVSSAKEFQTRLGCADKTDVKVVAIFGNVGDGKSYALNAAFFGGAPVFATSRKPDSCTVGVWAALSPVQSQSQSPASSAGAADAPSPSAPAPTPTPAAVAAAAEDQMAILCLDTEGLFGATLNQLQRLRLLLKVRHSSSSLLSSHCAGFNLSRGQSIVPAHFLFQFHSRARSSSSSAQCESTASREYCIRLAILLCVFVFGELSRENTEHAYLYS